MNFPFSVQLTSDGILIGNDPVKIFRSDLNLVFQVGDIQIPLSMEKIVPYYKAETLSPSGADDAAMFTNILVTIDLVANLVAIFAGILVNPDPMKKSTITKEYASPPLEGLKKLGFDFTIISALSTVFIAKLLLIENEFYNVLNSGMSKDYKVEYFTEFFKNLVFSSISSLYSLAAGYLFGKLIPNAFQYSIIGWSDVIGASSEILLATQNDVSDTQMFATAYALSIGPIMLI